MAGILTLFQSGGRLHTGYTLSIILTKLPQDLFHCNFYVLYYQEVQENIIIQIYVEKFSHQCQIRHYHPWLHL